MINVTEATYGKIHFSDVDWKKPVICPGRYLPGGEAFESGNDFGDFLYQHVQKSEYSFWWSLYFAKEDLVINLSEEREWLGFRVVFHKPIRHIVPGRAISLLPAQIWFAYSPLLDCTMHLRGNSLYKVFDMRVSMAFLRSLDIGGSLFTRLMDKIEIKKAAGLVSRPVWIGANLLDRIEQLTRKNTDEIFIRELLSDLVAVITSASASHRHITEGQAESVFRVREEMKLRYAEKMNLNKWALQAGMNITYLKEIFREMFGYSPYNYLGHIRLEAAKALIHSEPGLSFDQIALRTGFGNYNNLRRTFNTKEKISLTDWKKIQHRLLLSLPVEMVLLEEALY